MLEYVRGVQHTKWAVNHKVSMDAANQGSRRTDLDAVVKIHIQHVTSLAHARH